MQKNIKMTNKIWDVTFKTIYNKTKKVTGIIEANRDKSPVIVVKTQFGSVIIKKSDILVKDHVDTIRIAPRFRG